MRPRLWIPLLVLCLAVGLLLPARRRPNVLWIVVEGLRYDAISQSLGAARTPSLQRLAADGIGFPHCFAHTTDPTTALAALLSAHGPDAALAAEEPGPGRAVDDELPLVSEWLAAKGWRTVAVVSSPELQAPLETGLERGFATFEAACDARAERELGDERREHAPPHGAGAGRDVLATLLPLLAPDAGDAPWFALAQLSEPARPYDARGSEQAAVEAALDGRALETLSVGDGLTWRRELELAPGRHELVLASAEPFEVLACRAEGLAGPPLVDGAERRGPGRRVALRFVNETDATLRTRLELRLHDVPDLAAARRRYRLEVEEVDRVIGELCAALRRTGAYDDTVIVVTSTHGAALGEHGDVPEAANLHDEMLRVPLIVKPAAGDRRGAELAQSLYVVVRHVDVAPTVLDLAGVRPLPGAQGLSLFAAGDRTLVARAQPPLAPELVLAKRDERYKLVYRPAGEGFDLYDLHADTLEVDDVFEVRGHLRSAWQLELKALARRSSEPTRASLGFGLGPDLPTR